eukprot:TRINITY_DN11825_c0_g1_i2.p2 TRINITY_DN11825_c0_g1~~TRINITY_DN11825_c0_g1_i2.p2  ORF type:complete len:215 (+),score=72.49 TRINITY_DN11825_c0_g1_i2:937-1581(+)
MRAAQAEAERRGASRRELQHIGAELARLTRAAGARDSAAARRSEERADEAGTAARRVQGAALPPAAAATTAAPGYLQETDLSYTLRQALLAAGPRVEARTAAASVRCTKAVEARTSVSASVTTKQGKRALYYDVDLSVEWEGRCGDGDMGGVFRLYNVAHDTQLRPGGLENSSYMYQVGWNPHRPHYDAVTAAAEELFEPLAGAVDAEIRKLAR